MNTDAWLVAHEGQLRLAVFLVVFATLLGLQQLWPRREVGGGWRRRATNIALVIVDTAILRVAIPLLAFDLAVRLQQDSIGLLQGLPKVPGILLGMLLLDVSIYWQHRLFHAIPLLWRLHRVHHADTSFDTTTGVRFHPLEIVLSMGIKLGIIALFGIAPIAVLVFEMALSAGSLFTHTNLYLPAAFERRLRWFIVTPEMHRIHHSWHKDETDSNFSFHLSLWDRIFRSYRDAPRDGHTRMVIGLKDFRDPREQSLWALLLNPFRAPVGSSPVSPGAGSS
jgi:sterol desaturase/sphingolipid hydroxylase (fatty acid hydroxylase superfamily)